MPKFEWLFLKPLAASGIDFRSDDHIANINAPILIMHAEDDLVVPYALGRKVSMMFFFVFFLSLQKRFCFED